MNPEKMSPEQLRRMEISRGKSDEELLDEGASYARDTAEPGARLVVEEGTRERLQLEGEAALEAVKLLEGKELRKDWESLKQDVEAGKKNYLGVHHALSLERGLLREYTADHADGGRFLNSLKDSNFGARQWESALVLLRKVKEFAEKYQLDVPLFHMHETELLAGLEIDDVMDSAEQARLQTLYSAKEHLGRIQ
jgi:hypothetical protein